MGAERQLPDIAQVPGLLESRQIEILDLLFEPSPPLHEQCLPAIRGSTSSWHALVYERVGKLFRDLHTKSKDESRQSASSARETLDAILGSHPRLGAKKVDSAASSSEQAHLQSGSSETETKQLAELNAEYETTFPGLRFVVFVNGRPRSEIMEIVRQRIERGNIEKERDESIQAMLDIAWDRVKKMGGA